MNTNEHPPTESAFRPDHIPWGNNPCFGSDTQIAALNFVFADDGNSYLLLHAQLLSAERFSNPALEQELDAPPEKMLIRFLRLRHCARPRQCIKRLEGELQKYELKFCEIGGSPFGGHPELAHITAVTLTAGRDATMNPDSSLSTAAAGKISGLDDQGESGRSVWAWPRATIPPLVRSGPPQAARPSGALLREAFFA